MLVELAWSLLGLGDKQIPANLLFLERSNPDSKGFGVVQVSIHAFQKSNDGPGI